MKSFSDASYPEDNILVARVRDGIAFQVSEEDEGVSCVAITTEDALALASEIQAIAWAIQKEEENK